MLFFSVADLSCARKLRRVVDGAREIEKVARQRVRVIGGREKHREGRTFSGKLGSTPSSGVREGRGRKEEEIESGTRHSLLALRSCPRGASEAQRRYGTR